MAGDRRPPCDRAIYRLGDKDNFWQMADTGPCGPCTEIYVDLAQVARRLPIPAGRERASGPTLIERTSRTTRSSRVRRRAGSSRSGTSSSCSSTGSRTARSIPLPKPSVDTGAGLERIAAVKQGVTNNFHTDLFAPLIRTVEESVGFAYWGRESDEHRTGVRIGGGAGGADVVPNAVDPASFRVLADHARAVAFLLADGVFPSNEGSRLRAATHPPARCAPRLPAGSARADARARRADGDRHDERRLSRAAAARRASGADDADRGAGVPRDDRGRARAGSSSSPRRSRRTRGRSAERTRSGSTTPSASRSISRS